MSIIFDVRKRYYLKIYFVQDYVTSLNQEVDLLVNNYYVQRLELIYCILVFITSIFALCYLNLLIGVIVVFMTFLPIVFANLQGKKMRVCTDEYANSLKKLNVMTGDFDSRNSYRGITTL